MKYGSELCMADEVRNRKYVAKLSVEYGLDALSMFRYEDLIVMVVHVSWDKL